jgi:hypothetical protein
MALELIAPGAGGSDIAIFRRTRKRGAIQIILDADQTLLQCFEVRHHDADTAAHHLRTAGGQVKLLFADIDPHIIRTDHHVGITREA